MVLNNIADKLTDEQYEQNFADINPPLSENAAVAEAARCLFCFDAPCIKACPTHIDIPSFIKKIFTRNYRGSARTILEANIMGSTCAKVCPVEALCEGACVMNDKGEKPIEIGRLQRFSTDWIFAKNISLFHAGEKNGKIVSMVGAGPASLSCAAELVKLGYDVTVYDGKPLAGGLDTYGIASYKMRKQDSLREVEFVKDIGVKIVNNTIVGKDKSIDELLHESDAVFIGIGLGKGGKLNIPGEDLEGVYDAIDFIENLKSKPWRQVDVGRRVAVIGAGNTAVDAATAAKRLGAEEVMIIYRRSQKEMPAYEYEYELGKQDSVIYHWLTSPVRIIGDGVVEGIECMKMKLGDSDESGRRRPEPIPKSEFTMPVDMVIKALGQKAEVELIEAFGLKHENGLVSVDSETNQTSNPKVYAGGDCINGGREVVNAVQDGKKAAKGIHKMLFGEDVKLKGLY